MTTLHTKDGDFNMSWGSILGSLLVGGGGFFSSAINNKRAVKAAREQRAWLERMARNAHQYEVEDLRAAGLNPILSAGGSGASVSGASTAQTPEMDNPVASAVNAMDVFSSLENREADTSLKTSQTDVNNATEENLDADSAVKLAQAGKIAAETELTKGRVKQEGLKSDVFGAARTFFKPATSIVEKHFSDAQKNLKDPAKKFRDNEIKKGIQQKKEKSSSVRFHSETPSSARLKQIMDTYQMY